MTAIPSASPPPRIPIEHLLKGGREVILLHAGQEYRLRLTASNKVILTK